MSRPRGNPDEVLRRAERATQAGDLDAQARVEVTRTRSGLYPVDPEDELRWVQVTGPRQPWRRQTDSFPRGSGIFEVNRPYSSTVVSGYMYRSRFHLAQLAGPNVTVLEVCATGWPWWQMLGTERVSRLDRRPGGAPPVWIVPGQSRAAMPEGRLEHRTHALRVPLRARYFTCEARALSLANRALTASLRSLQALRNMGGANEPDDLQLQQFAAAGLLERAALATNHTGACRDELNLGWFYGWSNDVLPASGFHWIERHEWERQVQNVVWRTSPLGATEDPAAAWRIFDALHVESAMDNDLPFGPPRVAEWILGPPGMDDFAGSD